MVKWLKKLNELNEEMGGGRQGQVFEEAFSRRDAFPLRPWKTSPAQPT